MLVPGQQAPRFRATAHDGSELALDDLRGQRVLLWFYPEADTPGCTIEGNGLRTRAGEFAAAGCAIVGVSFDAVAKNHAFACKFDLPFPLLCDVDKTLGAAYDAIEPDGEDAGWPRRISFLIDRDGSIARVYWPVDVHTHAATVLADLASSS